MPKINPYLNFMGNTEEAFEFYRSVFGGEFAQLMRFREMPDAGNIPATEANLIMHVALPIGDAGVLMGTDALESMGHKLTIGDNISLAVSADSKEEADRLFGGLSAGGAVDLEMQDMFWGAYFGMLRDRFGVHWMVSYESRPGA